MSILEHLEKDSLYHAYLIEGARDEIIPEILNFLNGFNIKILGNPDLVQINLDTFKIDDARNLKSYASEKSFSDKKKFFLISVNSFLLEAQNSLLKMFEEPIENTHFFVIVPDINALLKTLVSRFYLIRTAKEFDPEYKEAENFISMQPKERINFIKTLLAVQDVEENNDSVNIAQESIRSKSLKFLNALEYVLHKKNYGNLSDPYYFEQFFKVRKFLRMPGSSVKSLMESIALITPQGYI